MGFIPGLRGQAGYIVGISDFTPRLILRGTHGQERTQLFGSVHLRREKESGSRPGLVGV